MNPGAGRQELSARERYGPVTSEPICQTSPRPVLRSVNQTRRQRVTFDIPTDANQRPGLINDKRLESALIDRAVPNCLLPPAKSDRMGSGYPMQQGGKLVRSRRTDHQMPVVGQHAVRNDGDWMSFQSAA